MSFFIDTTRTGNNGFLLTTQFKYDRIINDCGGETTNGYFILARQSPKKNSGSNDEYCVAVQTSIFGGIESMRANQTRTGTIFGSIFVIFISIAVSALPASAGSTLLTQGGMTYIMELNKGTTDVVSFYDYYRASAHTPFMENLVSKVLGRVCHQYPNLWMISSQERWLAARRPFTDGFTDGGWMSIVLAVVILTILATLLIWILVSVIRYVNRLRQRITELISTINRLQRQINKLKQERFAW
jgi:hypothetical protein